MHLKEPPIEHTNLSNFSPLQNKELMSLLHEVESDLLNFDKMTKLETDKTPEFGNISVIRDRE